MKRKNCVFCNIENNEIIIENDNAFIKYDINPVTEGHMLIIPKRHFVSFFEFKDFELQSIFNLLKKGKRVIKKKFPSVSSFNFAVNYGKAAGQKINHCHFHLVPRRMGDFDLRLKKIQSNENGEFFWISR